jgi:hypothetical protein
LAYGTIAELRDSDDRLSHTPALFRASLALVSAALTMIDVMFAALVAARLANVGANAADLVHESRTAVHERGRRPAKLRAIPVQPNAFGHFFHIHFAQASVRAVFTFLGTFHAGFDAGSIFLVGHCKAPS